MESLKGRYLIATAEMADQRFAETVIYMVAHGPDGAMGLVVNQPMPDMRFADVLEEIDLGEKGQSIRVPDRRLGQDVLRGGPVDTSRGFVLHTPDYFRQGNSLLVDDGICLTATLDVLRAIAEGTGPRHSLLALGYCGWSAGQLEAELGQNGWLTTATGSKDLLFSTPADRRYEAALDALGVTRATLSPHAGTA